MKEIEAAEKKLALDSNTHLIMQFQGNLKTENRMKVIIPKYCTNVSSDLRSRHID